MLIRHYETAWRRVLREQQAIFADPTRQVRRRRLEEISRSIAAIMDDLDVRMSDWIAQDFPRIYLTGLAHGARDIGGEVVWTTIHQRAVEELAYGVYDDLLQATTFVRDSTKALIRQAARQEGVFALVGGDTAQGAGRSLQRALSRQGIAAVVYRDGSRHGLAEYAQMNLRTTTALGYNVGTLNAGPEVVYWEVFDGPDCGWTSHDDTQALGMIVTRDEALGFPIAHPNCRRSFGARPDITSQQHANEVGRSPLIGQGQTTFQQRQAQIAQDKVRTARQRTARNRRQRRTRRDAA